MTVPLHRHSKLTDPTTTVVTDGTREAEFAVERERLRALAEAEREPRGTCFLHGDYWSDDCRECGW